MKSLVALVLLVLSAKRILPASSVSCDSLKDSSYSVIEKLLLTDKNLIALEKAFFPTNLHSSIVINVIYHFSTSQGLNQTNHVAGDIVNDEAAYRPLHTDLERKAENADSDRELLSASFRWLASPINLFIRPDLLKRLSLFTYQAPIVSINIYFESSCTGNFSQDIKKDIKKINSTCQNVPKLLKQLDEMTTNVSMA